MRQTHVAGDKLFVDWAGDTAPVIDPMTGEVHAAHLFVAALGASSYTYAEARWSETLPDWIGAHVNAFEFLGGVPKAAVPDNLKAGITKPSRYEPGVNRTYQDLADHYGFVVLPARIRRPRDKATPKQAARHAAQVCQPQAECDRRGSQHQGGARSRQGTVRQARDRRLDPAPTGPPDHRKNRYGKILARLRARQQRLP